MPSNPKPVLAMKHLPVFRVHYKALEEYVKKVFNFDYDFLFSAGVTEGCGVNYQVTGKLDTIAWNQRASALRLGKRQRDVILILNVLAADGYIPTGLYTISTQPLPDPTKVYTKLLQHTGSPVSPECIRHKNEHRDDKTFMERATILDKTFLEQKTP